MGRTTLGGVSGARGATFFGCEPTWLPRARFESPVESITLFDQGGGALHALKTVLDVGRTK